MRCASWNMVSPSSVNRSVLNLDIFSRFRTQPKFVKSFRRLSKFCPNIVLIFDRNPILISSKLCLNFIQINLFFFKISKFHLNFILITFKLHLKTHARNRHLWKKKLEEI
jgi:hypothetical protein